MTGPGKRAAIYVRVSTMGQSLRPQFAALRELAAGRGYQVVRVYRDRASGVKDRPALRRCLHDASMRQFDVLIVWALDRVGRSPVEVLARVRALADRGIGFLSAREAVIDTTTAAGELVLGVFAVVAGFERARLVERTKEALAHRKARGVKLGRPPALTPTALEAAAAAVAGGAALRAAARAAGVAAPTLRRGLRRRYGTTEAGTLARILAERGAA